MSIKLLNIETRKSQVLLYLKDYSLQHGYYPSLAEIGEHLRLTKTGAEYIVKKLVADGTIEKTTEKIRNLRLK